MQIKLLFRLVLAILPLSAFAQSSYIRTGAAEYEVLDRLEIKTRSTLLNQSFVKSYTRKRAFAAADSILKNKGHYPGLTAIDLYHLKQLLDDPESNSENVRSPFSSIGMHSKTANGYFFLSPVIRAGMSKESGNGNNPFITTIGIDTRGIIFKKIGYSFYTTANSERLPVYLSDWLSRYNTVPGAGNYKNKAGNKLSYMDTRGSLQTSVTKYIDLQIGYDKNFLGNGYRSLFLSDFSASTAFVKISTRIWKLNLQSLYMKLTPQYGIVNMADAKKYLRINTLGIDFTKWLNVSFFDAVVLGRKNGFDLNYILPVTFLRAMEQQSGSPDNALFGMNVKANLAGKIQLYGQVLLDEFKLSEIKAQSGWWANKYGYQLGIKYIDVLGIRNFDLQLETNHVRPFTYTHFDSVTNYTHYNQPLAHPLGANFQEFIGIARYQPTAKLYINAKAIYYKQGLDSLGFNTGNNVLINYDTRPRSYGWEVGSGNKATCLYLSLLVSYEPVKNLFMDISVMSRNFKTQLAGNITTTMISAGLRWNISRREFDF